MNVIRTSLVALAIAGALSLAACATDETKSETGTPPASAQTSPDSSMTTTPPPTNDTTNNPTDNTPTNPTDNSQTPPPHP
jgi:hypothetical protein